MIPAEIAIRSIVETWRQGQKVLVVFGAGASVKANIPSMKSVYIDLAAKVTIAKNELGSAKADLNLTSKWTDDENNAYKNVEDLEKWLNALAKEEASRSVAAMALGTLQKAHQRSNNRVYKRLAALWGEFSDAFINGEIPHDTSNKEFKLPDNEYQLARKTFAWAPLKASLKQFALIDLPESPRTPLPERDPTNVHRLVASWVHQGLATVISLNFDGLTLTALRSASSNNSDTPPQSSATVITDPQHIKNFYFGSGEIQNGSKLVSVIKVWGDVFHAVCTDSRCPEYQKNIPIFSFKKEPKNDEHIKAAANGQKHAWRQCPSCGEQRQLQIYFTGFEEKEKKAYELMEELVKFVAPEIGCIVCVGVSGLWDDALVRFLGTLAYDIQKNAGPLEPWLIENAPTRPDEKALSEETRTAFICIDPNIRPPLVGNLNENYGVKPTHLPIGAENFAALFEKPSENLSHPFNPKPPHRFENQGYFKEDMWMNLVGFGPTSPVPSEKMRPGPYSYLLGDDLQDNYLNEFQYMRQLGIKTRVFSNWQTNVIHHQSEQSHNRRKHSFGVGHLSLYWYHHYLKSESKLNLSEWEKESLATLVLYAAVHHDVGHIPFTHLAEEVFAEVNWTLHDWADPFRHDEPVVYPFNNLAYPFESESEKPGPIESTFIKAAKDLNLDPKTFAYWVESAIQGRSGRPWIDAILNSPLDVDKIDYVFRDCQFLNQGLHFASFSDHDSHEDIITKRNQEVKSFFDNTFILPSGMVALRGPAGLFARHLLEERRWLYKHQYFNVAYRALERISASIVLQWLLSRASVEFGRKYFPADRLSIDILESYSTKNVVNDTRTVKGLYARRLLWDKLLNISQGGDAKFTGEPELLRQMAQELVEASPFHSPKHESMNRWAKRCLDVIRTTLFPNTPHEQHPSLSDYLRSRVGISFSESYYIPFERLKELRKIIRQIETTRPFTAVFDIAVMPRMLAYPSRRRPKRVDGGSILQECFAVSHVDPDRWEHSTNRWIPLSESAISNRDGHRWAKIMAVSPFPDDPEVVHALDLLKALCRDKDIKLQESDPDETH